MKHQNWNFSQPLTCFHKTFGQERFLSCMPEVLDKEKAKQHVLPAKECFFQFCQELGFDLGSCKCQTQILECSTKWDNSYLVTHIPLRNCCWKYCRVGQKSRILNNISLSVSEVAALNHQRRDHYHLCLQARSWDNKNGQILFFNLEHTAEFFAPKLIPYLHP